MEILIISNRSFWRSKVICIWWLQWSFLNNSAYFSLFTSSPSSPTLRSPWWLMVLAAGSKLAVHLMSNVLYHSPLSRLSDLAAVFMQRQAWLSSRHAGPTLYIFHWLCNAKSMSTWPMKYWRLSFWNDSASILLSNFKPNSIQQYCRY